jgi:membrane-bound serine protease (ClpP class)
VGFFMNPFISGLLILVIIAGIYFEMQAPGLGFAGLAALVALVLYLVPYYLNGLAENWEIICFFIGILLLAAEVFVLPGFGIAGALGIGMTAMSLILIMVNNDVFDFEFVKMNDILIAASSALGGFIGGGVLLFIIGAKFTDSRYFQRVALAHTQDSNAGYTATVYKETLITKQGLAHTVLRPSGKVLIDDVVYDAYTRGEFIEKGQRIEVVSNEGTSLRVKVV